MPGWIGWGVDLLNPADDLATVLDFETMLAYDPTQKSPEEYFGRIRAGYGKGRWEGRLLQNGSYRCVDGMIIDKEGRMHWGIEPKL